MNIKITYLRYDGKKYKPRESEYDILVFIKEHHYIQIKSNKYV